MTKRLVKLLDGLCQGAAYLPSFFQSVFKGRLFNAAAFSPFRKAQGFPVVGEKPVVSAVSGLLFWACPPAVVGAVVAIIVYPVKAVLSRWFHPHIDIESVEGVQPLLADNDAPATIGRILTMVRVEASTLHFTPYGVYSVSTIHKPSIPLGRTL